MYDREECQYQKKGCWRIVRRGMVVSGMAGEERQKRKRREATFLSKDIFLGVAILLSRYHFTRKLKIPRDAKRARRIDIRTSSIPKIPQSLSDMKLRWSSFTITSKFTEQNPSLVSMFSYPKIFPKLAKIVATKIAQCTLCQDMIKFDQTQK